MSEPIVYNKHLYTKELVPYFKNKEGAMLFSNMMAVISDNW